MSRHGPRFTDEERFRIRTAKVDLAIALEEWMSAGAPAEKVVNAVEELMLAVKILKRESLE